MVKQRSELKERLSNINRNKIQNDPEALSENPMVGAKVKISSLPNLW